MKVVTVRNRLDKEKIIIREGNASVYRQLAVVRANKDFQLTIDPNATYREYVLITLSDNTELPAFSSDDILEFSEIVVKENKDSAPRFYWEGDPVPPPANAVPDAATLGNEGAVAPSKPSLIQKIRNFLQI